MAEMMQWSTGPKHPVTESVGLVVSGSFTGSEPWLKHVFMEAARIMGAVFEKAPPFEWQVAPRHGGERWLSAMLQGYGRTVHETEVDGDLVRDAVAAVVDVDAAVLIWDGDSVDVLHAMHACEDAGVPYVAVELDQWGAWHVLRRQSSSPTPWLDPHRIETLGQAVRTQSEEQEEQDPASWMVPDPAGSTRWWPDEAGPSRLRRVAG